MEFATAQNPNAATSAKPTLMKTGATLEFTCTRSLAAIPDGVIFSVKWRDVLASGAWSMVRCISAWPPTSVNVRRIFLRPESKRERGPCVNVACHSSGLGLNRRSPGR